MIGEQESEEYEEEDDEFSKGSGEQISDGQFSDHNKSPRILQPLKESTIKSKKPLQADSQSYESEESSEEDQATRSNQKPITGKAKTTRQSKWEEKNGSTAGCLAEHH